MTAATPNLETASRNIDELAGEGVYYHRRLGEMLFDAGFPLWKTEKEKTAFLIAQAADRAPVIVAGLRAYDAARGGAPVQAAPATIVQAAPPVETPAAAPARTPRTPRGTAAAAAAAPAGVAQTAPAAGADLSAITALITAIQALDGNLGSLASTLEAQAKNTSGLTSSVGSVQTGINEIKGMLSGIIGVQRVELGLLCLFGQQVLGAPMEDFIGSAVGDADKALDHLEALEEAAAKAKGKG